MNQIKHALSMSKGSCSEGEPEQRQSCERWGWEAQQKSFLCQVLCLSLMAASPFLVPQYTRACLLVKEQSVHQIHPV